MRRSLALLLALALSSCGGGAGVGGGGLPPSEPTPVDPGWSGVPPVPLPPQTWLDYQPTPGGGLGVVNGTLRRIIQIDAGWVGGAETWLVGVEAGASWEADVPVPVGAVFVRARGADGSVFERWFWYDPSVGREAAVLSLTHWATPW